MNPDYIANQTESVKPVVFKMLECIHPNTDLGIEVGQQFRVVKEDDTYYQVNLPFETENFEIKNRYMVFTKEPDFEGYSYKNWFTVVEQSFGSGE